MIARRVRLLDAPRYRGGGGGKWSELARMRVRFRKWAAIYWPEALK